MVANQDSRSTNDGGGAALEWGVSISKTCHKTNIKEHNCLQVKSPLPETTIPWHLTEAPKKDTPFWMQTATFPCPGAAHGAEEATAVSQHRPDGRRRGRWAWRALHALRGDPGRGGRRCGCTRCICKKNEKRTILDLGSIYGIQISGSIKLTTDGREMS